MIHSSSNLVVAGTGHRPPKLLGYGRKVHNQLVDFAIQQMSGVRVGRIISGMALGWDQALADAAIRLHIPLTAAIPSVAQPSVWPKESRDFYHALLELADRVVDVSKVAGYQSTSIAGQMDMRNRWMVDQAQIVLALWDGSPGGTGNCVRYAKSRQVDIHNLWPTFDETFPYR